MLPLKLAIATGAERVLQDGQARSFRRQGVGVQTQLAQVELGAVRSSAWNPALSPLQESHKDMDHWLTSFFSSKSLSTQFTDRRTWGCLECGVGFMSAFMSIFNIEKGPYHQIAAGL